MVSPGLGLYVKNGGGGDRTRDVSLHEPRRRANLDLDEIRRTLVARDGDECFYCEARHDFYQVDHVVPFTAGGSDNLENLVLACALCNYAKRAWPGWLFLILRETGHEKLPVPFERRLAFGDLADRWLRGNWTNELRARLGEIREVSP